MNQETYKIETLQDLVQFDEEQLERLFADLKIWVRLRREAEAFAVLGMQMRPYMEWRDDGQTGLSSVSIEVKIKEGKRND